MSFESNARWLLGVHVVDRNADPIQFAFQRDMMDKDTVNIEISQHDWAQIGPFQSAGLLIDLYFDAYPEEVQRVGHRVVTSCVMRALALDRN
ncbi:hypothetical protein SAMN06265337_1931 [Hymenobacter gelipurpurascens]|uniref:Uncharacterized protein n=1 Tax=Hymenobacter gelipurpurascens TaxID=89968 RepID=A0A212TNG9_9BACT|nr:hypothetical protein [Hymenobacter gelipurpurascens]SNC67381.1 hypothetical protein SAMN06265337_1931 [Hymenobacter gelipurpurascens]